MEQVFERATDLSGMRTGCHGVLTKCSQVSEGPVRLGTTYIDQGWMGSFRGEVSEFDRPSRVVYKETLRWFGATVVVARIEYEFSPDPRGTAVHHVGESELHGIFRLMRPMVAVIGAANDKDCRGHERSLEADASRAPSQAPACRASRSGLGSGTAEAVFSDD